MIFTYYPTLYSFYGHTLYTKYFSSRLEKEYKTDMLLKNLKAMQLITMSTTFGNCLDTLTPHLPLFTYNAIANESCASILLRLKKLKLSDIEKMLLITIVLFSGCDDGQSSRLEAHALCGYVSTNLLCILHNYLPSKWDEVTPLIKEFQQIGYKIYEQCLPFFELLKSAREATLTHTNFSIQSILGTVHTTT